MNIQDYLNTSVLRQLLYCIRQKTNIYMNIYIYIYMETKYMNRHALCGWNGAEQDRTEHV